MYVILARTNRDDFILQLVPTVEAAKAAFDGAVGRIKRYADENNIDDSEVEVGDVWPQLLDIYGVDGASGLTIKVLELTPEGRPSHFLPEFTYFTD